MRKKIELNVPWSEFLRIMDRIDELKDGMEKLTERQQKGESWNDVREEFIKLSKEYKELDKREDEIRNNVIPEVGATGTIHWYSDSSKAKVTKVLSPKTIEVTACGLYHCTKIFTFRPNGHWIEKGTTSRDWGTIFSWGRGHDYYDESF